MISICIPFYNYPNEALLKGLINQIRKADFEHELIVIDDCSAESNRLNIDQFGSALKYVQLEENIGRSRIRNLFLKYAKHPYLLFLDGDSELVSDQFLSRYEEILRKQEDVSVICGRSIYPKEVPALKYRLRWMYGNQTESKSAQERNKQPYASFMTNNLVLKAELLKRIPFEEKLEGYGHEDTLMGFRLKAAKIPVMHIDNPVLNAQPDKNSVFLSKTSQALSNLLEIQNSLDNSDHFIAQVKILRWLQFSKKLKLNSLLSLLEGLIGNTIRKKLEAQGGGLKLFAFWKLIVLASLEEEQRKSAKKE